MFTYILYGICIVLLIISACKSKQKTKMALKKAWRSFENILPQFITILIIIGLMLAILDKKVISSMLGSSSGVLGMVIAGVIGSITLIPGFVAFPLASSLIDNGAGYGQIAMFISTLMMVGIVTLPLEISYFGKRVAVKRNLFAVLFSIVVAVVIGGVLA